MELIARRRATVVLIAAGVAIAALALLARGGGSDLDAEEFVERANEEGAGLTLGEPLSSTAGAVYAVRVGQGGEGGSGSVSVLEDIGEAQGEFGRCEATGTLICFRAENVVLELEDTLPPAELQLISAAIAALGD